MHHDLDYFCISECLQAVVIWVPCQLTMVGNVLSKVMKIDMLDYQHVWYRPDLDQII